MGPTVLQDKEQNGGKRTKEQNSQKYTKQPKFSILSDKNKIREEKNKKTKTKKMQNNTNKEVKLHLLKREQVVDNDESRQRCVSPPE